MFIAESEILGLLTDVLINDSNETTTAYLLAIALSLLTLIVVFANYGFFMARKVGGLIRILLISNIYCKVTDQSIAHYLLY